MDVPASNDAHEANFGMLQPWPRTFEGISMDAASGKAQAVVANDFRLSPGFFLAPASRPLFFSPYSCIIDPSADAQSPSQVQV